MAFQTAFSPPGHPDLMKVTTTLRPPGHFVHRAASTQDGAGDRFEPSPAPPLDFKQAVKELFPQTQTEAGNPKVDWKIEKVRSLPWIGSYGQMFMGISGNQSTPFESEVQFRNSPDQVRWTRKITGNLKRQPVGFGDRVLALLDEPFKMISLNPMNGEVEWESKNIHGPMVLDESQDQIFARTFRQEVVRINPGSGTRRWVAKPEGVPLKLESTPAGLVAGSNISHKTGESRVTLFDADTGAKRWSVPSYNCRFAVHGERVFVPAASSFPSEKGNEITILDLSTGEAVGSLKTEARQLNPLYCDGRRLYAGRLGHSRWDLVAFNLKTGELEWSQELGHVSQILPGEDDQVYAVGERSLYCLDPMGGHPIWKAHAGSSPQLSVQPDGTVLTLSQFGELRAFNTPDLKEKALESGETFEFEFRGDEVVIGDFALPRQE